MIKQYFEELTDKRQTHKVKHNMLEIIIMTICAVIAGCEACFLFIFLPQYWIYTIKFKGTIWKEKIAGNFTIPVH